MKKGNNLGCLAAIVIFVMLVLAMVVSRPDEQAHRNAVSDVVAKALTETTDSLVGTPADAESMAMHHVGSALTKTLTREVVEHLVTVDDYGILTVGSVNLGDEKKPVSVGVLGHVFTADKETIKAVASSYVQKKLNHFVDGIQDAANSFIDSLLK